MGTISKHSKIPQIQTNNSYPVVEVTPDPVPAGKTEEQIASETRTQGLLRRSRGRFGTVLTGFSGFLNSKNGGEKEPRKTLLGE